MKNITSVFERIISYFVKISLFLIFMMPIYNLNIINFIANFELTGTILAKYIIPQTLNNRDTE